MFEFLKFLLHVVYFIKIFCMCYISGDISKFVNNIEWIVEEMPAERNVLIYKCCPEPYTDVTYSIVMKVIHDL